MCRENARSSMEKSTRGAARIAETQPPGAGFRMQAQARGRPQPGARRCPASERERRDREVVRRKSKFSAHPPCCSVHGAQQRGKPGIAHNALFRARKEKTARRAVPASGLRNTQAQMWGGPASGFRAFSQEDVCALPRKVRGIPKLRGSRDGPRTMPETSDATKPTPGWKQPSPQESGPG